MSTKRKSKRRKPAGVSFVALTLVIAFFVVLPLCLLGFELSRFMLMQQELHHVTDAAALAGTAALAYSPIGMAPSIVQNLAMQVAGTTFEQNSILQTPLNIGNVAVNADINQNQNPPPPHNAVLNITLYDDHGVAQPVGSTTVSTMQVQGIYSDVPTFLSNILPIANVETAYANSSGGLPQLDLALAYDVSGSMDDSTASQFVLRQWASTQCQYTILIPAGGANTIVGYVGPPDYGTGLNVAWPQQLGYSGYAPPDSYQLIFSEGNWPTTNYNGLRADLTSPGVLVPEQGCPPGDKNNPTHNPYLTGTYPSNLFTDVVVPSVVAGWTTADAVEASRGNLESAAYLASACGSASNISVTPGPGYYSSYWSGVNSFISPMAQARRAATNFFTTMNNSTNGHFALQTFTDITGTSPTSTWSEDTVNIDPNYSGGGTFPNGFPLPLISLNAFNSNYATILSSINGSGSPGVPGYIPPLCATGGTQMTPSLTECVNELTSPVESRPAAKRPRYYLPTVYQASWEMVLLPCWRRHMPVLRTFRSILLVWLRIQRLFQLRILSLVTVNMVPVMASPSYLDMEQYLFPLPTRTT